MAENTAIEWADHTFNPWVGCQKVGPGCDFCYAEGLDLRFAPKGSVAAPHWGPGAPRRRTSASNWHQPVRWNDAAPRFLQEHGRRQRVFCASLADVFDNAVDDQWRADLADLIVRTPELDWMLLTKRIGNAPAMLGRMFPRGMPEHVWIGATVVNQEEADRDIPKLRDVRASVRFLSIEPMLGPVDLSNLLYDECPNWAPDGYPPPMDPTTGTQECCSGCDYTGIGDELAIHWVICGGESGHYARPMHPRWARSLRDQCAAAGVPFLFKQWGEWLPGEIYSPSPDGGLARFPDSPDPDDLYWGKRCHWWDDTHALKPGPISVKAGKKAAGRMLDGRTHDGFPASA